ncbi:transglycosylase SLT domain-containing protein [Pseudorhodoplanes sp.]|uniref:transglycosylase SLT domain-containing protein n=1 Tax=Pseudorhodoplanes sp. TaxID=1934341 RepID=UPI003918BF1B
MAAFLPQTPAKAAASDDSICLLIESAARDHGLPLEFFARVIWQESRFRADAVGPKTRSGHRAQGMAQFMPYTAAERGLLDPFDPVQALPKSAEFLKELWLQFGNLGLAAAAYNAGPRRVREWLAGTGPMPGETRNYVSAITGMTVDDWAAERNKPSGGKETPKQEQKRDPGCGEVMAMLKRSPSPFLEQLTQRVVHSLAQPWGVQLGAGFSRDRAMAMYARALRRYESVLAGKDPGIQSSVMRTRGRAVFYQVRIGAETRAEANALCNSLRKAGGACLVMRNRG